jgi:hypothetical protein
MHVDHTSWSSDIDRWRNLHKWRAHTNRCIRRQIGQVIIPHIDTRNRFIGRGSYSMRKSRNIDDNTGSGIRKHRLVKNDVTGNINTSRGPIETFVSLMHRTIPKKRTHSGSESELACIILTQTRPACATKGAKESVIGLNSKKAMEGCVLMQNRSRHAIYKVAGNEERLVPIAKGKRRVGQES